jgi:DNA-binding IclR family transcriptional regulator
MNREQAIKAALAGGPLTCLEVAERLGLTAPADVQKVRSTISDMKSRGVLERLDQEPRYRLTGRGREEMQRKIWRALSIRGVCTPKQAALLAECSRDYARRYLYWLAAQGWVLRDADSAICRVNPDKAGDPPHWNRMKEEGRVKGRGQQAEKAEGRGQKAAKKGEET